MGFNKLTTEQFRTRMLPHAIRVYQQRWPKCQRVDIRKCDLFGGCLDSDFGIDAVIKFPDGWWLTIQEKFRDYEHWKAWGDFTMEVENASGTIHAAPGEWFKLGAQLYFYGWANQSESGFQEWKLLDVAALKLIIHQQGGLESVGRLRSNKKHGRATFYGIPFEKIESAVVSESDLHGGHSPLVTHWQEKC